MNEEDRPVLVGMTIKDGKIGDQIKMDLDNPGEYISVPVYENMEIKEEDLER